VISTFYIGIRVKGGIEVTIDAIDFTSTRRSFFDWLNTDNKNTDNKPASNAVFQNLLQADLIDLKIEYKSRDSLPDEVRPKPVEKETCPNNKRMRLQ
jgi:hypothetical protein